MDRRLQVVHGLKSKEDVPNGRHRRSVDRRFQGVYGPKSKVDDPNGRHRRSVDRRLQGVHGPKSKVDGPNVAAMDHPWTGDFRESMDRNPK